MKVKVRVGDYHSQKSESATGKCVSGCKRVVDYLIQHYESESGIVSGHKRVQDYHSLSPT